jgi:hypothetical protein
MFLAKVVQKVKTHILLSETSPPPPKNRAVYEIKWKNIVVGEATKDNMAHAHSRWIPKATNTHSEYVTFIAFLL